MGICRIRFLVKVCDDFVTANDTKFVSSRDDFYFTVNEVSGGKLKSKNGANDADELLKWKQLMDAGVITREEFEAKKSSLLGL